MSTPRGGRVERSRAARGNAFARATTSRSRGNSAPAEDNTERPAQQIYTRGSSRGSSRGRAARGNTTNTSAHNSTNTRASTRGRENHSAFTTPLSALTGGLNSTPFAQDDYSKRLEHIRAARPKLRERFVNEGRMNPDGQMRLCDSVKLFGLCTDMCPEYERVRRIVEEDVKPPECTPETQHLPRKQRIPDETRMVKAYARSAAGMDVELVSEIRSPATCLKTIEYLMQRLDNDEFDFLHSWIWDRTRAVRKDLRTQRIESRSDINILLTCLERSARFFILSAHQMARSEKQDYSHQQDFEQLNQTMTSLSERYVDNRRVNYPSENEAEFHAYRLIMAPLFSNAQHEYDLQGMPEHLRKNSRVKTAIAIYRAMNAVLLNKSSCFNEAQANWKRLWEVIKSPSVSYLMACAAEFSFQRIRHVILDTLWRVYRYGNQNRPQTIESWTTVKVRDVMAFDTNAEAVQFCQIYGFQFNSIEGRPAFLDVTARGFAKDPLERNTTNKDQIFSQRIVEEKRKDRAFSAIVQAMPVEEAQRRGLMSEPSHEETNGETNGEMEDETSLFVPETRPAQNPFTQPKSSSLDPTSNPFLPKATVDPGSGAARPNPFLPAQPIIPTSGAAKPNPFLPKPTPFAQDGTGSGTGTVQPGLFDPSKNQVKFAPTDLATTTPVSSSKPNPFLPASTAASATSTANAANGATSQPFNFFTPAAKASPQTTTAQTPTATPPTTNTSTFSFLGSNEAAPKATTEAPSFSFTPAGSPAPAGPTPQELEKQKAEEEAQRKKAAAEAVAQRQRKQQEQARQVEQQRIAAEQQRQRWQEEERNRQIREAQEMRMREEAARLAREQARDKGYQTLTEDIMFDVNDGLMMQFIENLISVTTTQVMAADRERKLEEVRKKQEAVADAMAHQRLLALQRFAMIKLMARAEKRKRDQKARERRKRLREQKANRVNVEDGASAMPTPKESGVQAERTDNETTFRKPQVPASARRARRTEERRGTASSQSTSQPVMAPPAQQPVAQSVLTPISMDSNLTSGGTYSEAYRKSTAPIDRTETDWFTLRAEGFEPSMLRKRSFDASADENEPDVEAKRPKMSPTSSIQPPVPQTTSIVDRHAPLEALGQQFRKSAGSPQSASGSASFNGRSSLGKSTSMLIEQARRVLSRSKASTQNTQHDYGRSVPNLHRRTMSAQPSVLGRSIGATNRAAYWDRPSRFVPKECYGQGANAVRDYRIKYGLSSPANTRPNSTEPTAVSSPIPQQTSYMPVNGYTQEQYSGEESSGIEVVDVDAEEENIGTTEEEENATSTEEEYEGDEESEDGYQNFSQRQSHPKAYGQDDYDEDGDSPMHDGQLGYGDDSGYVNGQYADEALIDYEGYTEESEIESDEESESQYTQRAKTAQKQPAQLGGNCEEDAIELSD